MATVERCVMSARGGLAWLAAVTAIACCGLAAQADASVYWANQSGTIGRANLDGSSPVQGFIGGGSGPIGVAVDARHVYWTNSGAGTIGRANLDGSGINQSFITGASNPLAVAVDGAHVYWTNANTSAIGRANLDGSGVNQSFITGALGVVGVAVDARYVYWTRSGAIGRANLDGSGVDQGFIAAFAPNAVAVDGEHVYWATSGTSTLGRANLDGSNVNDSFITGANQPTGVAVDGLYVYWLNSTGASIGRANLDGSNPDQAFIASAVSFGQGVAVDGGPAGSASASATDLGFGTQPLGTLGEPQSLTITNSGHGNLEIDAARVTGGDVDDFLISRDTCSQRTLTIGATCTVHVRFGPSAGGERRATLALASNDAASPLAIALQGTAGQLPQGPSGGSGPTGAPGARGPAGAQGRSGRVRLVTCRTVTTKVRGHRVKRRRCTTRLASATATFTTAGTARASLTRRDVLYAAGTASGTRLVLQLRRRLPAGRYTLTLTYRRHGARIATRTPIAIA
jgi:streptogramin lyase